MHGEGKVLSARLDGRAMAIGEMDAAQRGGKGGLIPGEKVPGVSETHELPAREEVAVEMATGHTVRREHRVSPLGAHPVEWSRYKDAT